MKHAYYSMLETLQLSRWEKQMFSEGPGDQQNEQDGTRELEGGKQRGLPLFLKVLFQNKCQSQFLIKYCRVCFSTPVSRYLMSS